MTFLCLYHSCMSIPKFPFPDQFSVYGLLKLANLNLNPYFELLFNISIKQCLISSYNFIVFQVPISSETLQFIDKFCSQIIDCQVRPVLYYIIKFKYTINLHFKSLFNTQIFIKNLAVTHMPPSRFQSVHQIPKKLVKLILDYDQNYSKFQKLDFYSDNKEGYYFLISAAWLQEWKTAVLYDAVVSTLKQSFSSQNAEMSDDDEQINGDQMPLINSDIIDDKFSPTLKLGAHPHLNIALKLNLQQRKDYLFLTQDLWDLFIEYGYNAREVKRYIEETNDGKKVEIYYQQLTIAPITNQILKDYEYERRSTLMTFTFQVSHYIRLKKMLEIINFYLKKFLTYQYTCYLPQNPAMRLWLATESTKKNILYNTLRQGCAANSTFSYKIFFDGELIYKNEDQDDFLQQPSQSPRIIDLQDPITPTSLVLLQIRQKSEEFILFNHKNYPTSECSHCRQNKVLKHMCSCKFMVYCSRQCLLKDRTYHEGRCPNNAQSDEEQKEEENKIVSLENSRGGTGLRNLGNTCFMNSGLQCLAHIRELTQYFLRGDYVQDINTQNVLGTQGELCTAYAKMVKSLWCGNDTSFSPTQLKRAIGKFQPMFSGYNQHDSGELITYLLDGLHEDLNRVKKKPYVETKDYDGRPDQIIAKQQWNQFLMRNQSQIVDLMYGQYRSVVDCPNCSYRSIQFDPFCMVSLPIINNSLKRIEITYLQNHILMQKFQISFDKSWNWTMANIIEDVRKKIQKPDSRLVTYVASYATCEIIQQSRSANEVRSQYKYRTIFIRELEADQDYLSPETVRICVGHTICHSYYKDESYRKTISQFRLYFINGETKLSQLHHKIFNYYREVFPFMLPDSSSSSKEPASGLSQTLINFYKKNIIIQEEKAEEETKNEQAKIQVQVEKIDEEQKKKDSDDDSFGEEQNEKQSLLGKKKIALNPEQPIRLLSIPTSRYAKCEYCGQKGCEGCIIPYSNTITIKEFVQQLHKKKAKDKSMYYFHQDKKKKDQIPIAQFELYYRKHSSLVEDSFNELNEGKMAIKKLSENSKTKSEKDDNDNIIELGNVVQEEYAKKPATHQNADTSLSDCFGLFEQSETLGQDNAWYCPKCKDFVLAKKQMQIYKAPKVLIMCLKRFKRKQYFQEKYNILVDFPINNLDMSPFIIHSELPSGHLDDETIVENMDTGHVEGPVLYDLFAISNHFGGTGGGHYTAYCKHPVTNQWFDCDDSYVREIKSENELISESAYILFYKRKQ